MSAPYRDGAPSYINAGWVGVVPVYPCPEKSPPAKGYTGKDGVDTTPTQVEQWRAGRLGNWLVALRMPETVIGLDVDHYDKTDKTGVTVAKRGMDKLTELESQWGKLPATWKSSARGAANPSGIRFYRVPAQRYGTGVGDAIEVIQRHHRYAIVAPSPHMSTDAVYAWYRADGSAASPGEVPDPRTLPQLPRRWVDGLAAMASPAHERSGDTELIEKLAGDDRPLCSVMAHRSSRVAAQLRAALTSGAARHDVLMKKSLSLAYLAAEGHAGLKLAYDDLGEVWDQVTDGRGDEFDTLTDGAVSIAVNEREPRPIDPCEGGSGLGIEIIAEGNRRPVVIVEGADSAHAIAEYAAADVTVIGMDARESWRKEGVPAPELGAIVTGNSVVIVLGPEVATHLNAYESAHALAAACVGKHADFAQFAQPPGTIGVTVAKWLDSLAEDEKPDAVAKLLATTTAKPAPDKSKLIKTRAGLADDLDSELPLTNDTFIGTTWADEHLGAFRYLTTDKTWLHYRDGRWSTEDAGAELGHSTMEFISQHGTPLALAAGRVKGADPEEHEKLQRAYDSLMSTRKRQAVQGAAADYRPMHVRRAQLDQHPRLWCAANGVVNLDTGEVIPHDPGLLLTAGSDVEYRPERECRRFDRFLAETLPDPEVRSYVLRLFFLAMYGEVIEHVFPTFIGEGRNGKGALIRIMEKVFGAAFAPVNASSLLERKFEKHEEEIAHLAGKRLVVCQEPTRGARWDAERIKSWTGGDTLTGRPMHGHRFSFAPSHTLIMVSNRRPNVDGDTAFWARYREVPFNVSFAGHEDPTMEPEIIANELPGVLNRLLEAGRDYQAIGRLGEPAAVVLATEGTRVESDHMARFATERVKVTNEGIHRISNAEMYGKLTEWWRVNELPFTELPKLIGGAFAKEMRRALKLAPDAKTPVKMKIDGKVTLTWVGVQWVTDSDDEPADPGFNPPWHVGNPVLKVGNPGLGSPNFAVGQVAELSDQVAEWLPTSNDQDSGIAPAESVAVAEVAEVAEIETHITAHTRDEERSQLSQEDSLPSSAIDVQKGRVGNLGNSATVSVANDLYAESPPSNGATVTPISVAPAGTTPCPRCSAPVSTTNLTAHIAKRHPDTKEAS